MLIQKFRNDINMQRRLSLAERILKIVSEKQVRNTCISDTEYVNGKLDVWYTPLDSLLYDILIPIIQICNFMRLL